MSTILRSMELSKELKEIIEGIKNYSGEGKNLIDLIGQRRN